MSINDPRMDAINRDNADWREPEWGLWLTSETYTLPNDAATFNGASYVRFDLDPRAESDWDNTVTFLDSNSEPMACYPGDDRSLAVQVAQGLRLGEAEVCEVCGEWVYRDRPGDPFVTYLSGDDGGTYDLCGGAEQPHRPFSSTKG